MTADAKSLKNSYVIQWKVQNKVKPLDCLLSVYIKLYFKDRRVRDWDNWHKISMDSLTWIIYKDDSQIKLATIEIMPIDKENPRIELYFEEI